MAPALLWKPDPHAADDEEAYLYTHASGRTFYITVLERWDEAQQGFYSAYFLREATPSPYLLLFNEQGYCSGREPSPTLETLIQSPNTFFTRLKTHGIPEGRLCLDIGGFGLGSLTFPSRQAVNDAIWQVISDNVWYQHHSPELAQAQQDDASYQQHQREMSRQYHQGMVDSLEAALASTSATKGAGSWLPSSDNQHAIHHALLSFRNAPSLETWTQIAHQIVLPTGSTGWHIWTKHDASAPRSLTLDGGFGHYPKPEAFFGWLSKTAEMALKEHRKKLAEITAQ